MSWDESLYWLTDYTVIIIVAFEIFIFIGDMKFFFSYWHIFLIYLRIYESI